MFNLYFNSHISDTIEAMALKLGSALDLSYAWGARFDNLDLDVRSQCVGKGKQKSALNYLDN